MSRATPRPGGRGRSCQWRRCSWRPWRWASGRAAEAHPLTRRRSRAWRRPRRPRPRSRVRGQSASRRCCCPWRRRSWSGAKRPRPAVPSPRRWRLIVPTTTSPQSGCWRESSPSIPRRPMPGSTSGLRACWTAIAAGAREALDRARALGVADRADEVEWLLATAEARIGRLDEARARLTALCDSSGAFKTPACEAKATLR